MKLSVKRESFMRALLTAAKAVPARTTKDILKNIKLEATTNAITLIATDTEIGLRVEVSDVIHSDAGQFLFPAARVIAILNECESDEVQIEESGAMWIRGSGRGAKFEFRLLIEESKDFPDVARFDSENAFTVSAGDLRRLIRRTIFATDTESTRFALGGVQVEFNKNMTVVFAATDSRRLAVDMAAFGIVGIPEAPTVAPVVPAKALKLIAGAIDDSGDVQVAFDKHGISVRSGLVTITSQLVDGRFPDWRKIMPSSANQTAEVVVGPFLSAMRQVMVMRSEESRAAAFAFSKGMLRLESTAKTSETKDKKKTLLSDGQSTVRVPVEYDGEAVAINFDAVYVADVLKVLNVRRTVQFRLIGLDDPGLLVVGDYRYLLMPISGE